MTAAAGAARIKQGELAMTRRILLVTLLALCAFAALAARYDKTRKQVVAVLRACDRGACVFGW